MGRLFYFLKHSQNLQNTYILVQQSTTYKRFALAFLVISRFSEKARQLIMRNNFCHLVKPMKFLSIKRFVVPVVVIC